MEKNPAEGNVPSPQRGERRTNLLLRTLITELMEQVREVQRHSGPWPAEERARLEADLERIMSQVRDQAFSRPPTQ
jgi:hypothetical protein